MDIDNREQIEAIIESVKEVYKEKFGKDNPIEYFVYGKCYYFALILQNIIPEAVLYDDGGHAIVKIGRFFYDATGCLGNGKIKIIRDGATGITLEETDKNVSDTAMEYLKHRGTFVLSTQRRQNMFKYPNPDVEERRLEKCRVAIEIAKNKHNLSNHSQQEKDVYDR